MLPPPPFLYVIVGRAALIWIFLRSIASVGSTVNGAAFREAVVGPPLTAMVLCGAVIIVSRIELWRQSEAIFLANLGYSFARLAAVIVLECAILETALRLSLA